jgi:transposase-like protein
LQHLQESCGVRQTGRLVGVNKNTVIRLAVLAGQHAQQLHDELVAFSPKDPGGAVR